MSSYVEEEGDGDEELLELCSLVEEYKEALGTVEAANVNLQAQVQKLQQENESLKETTRQQEGVIQRLDDSVNQLMEDIEQQNEIIETKNSDLQSLQHCLSVIHRRKVEVDDQTQIEQTKIIEKLYAEKSRISDAYSANLKILEEYLDIINAKDSEILDLKLVIQTLEQALNTTEISERGDPTTEAANRPATSTTGTPPAAARRPVGPSPPANSPPAMLRNGLRSTQSATYTTNPSADPGAGGKSLASIRAASAAALRRASTTSQYTSDEDGGDGDDGDNSPSQPVTINRSRVSKLTRRNTAQTPNGTPESATDTTAGAAQKAAALEKYRKYASLHAAPAAPDGREGDGSGDAALNAMKWSDVGKHEGLFDKVDIIKDRSAGRGPTYPTQGATSLHHARASSAPEPGLVVRNNSHFDDEMHDSMEYAPDSPPRRGALHSALPSRSGTADALRGSGDGLVEVFVQSDSSNPASPERMKPNKPLFKPPFSKPVFNEFTPNTSKTASQGVKQPPPALTSSTSVGSGSFPSKTKFDAYVNKKGGNYALGKDADDVPTLSLPRSSAGDAKAVTWADAKGTGLSAYDSGVGASMSRAREEKQAEDRHSGLLGRSGGSASSGGGAGGGGLARQEAKSSSGGGGSAPSSARGAPPAVKENSWLSWGSSGGTSSSTSGQQPGGEVRRGSAGGAGWLGRAPPADGNESPNYTRL